LTLYLAKLQVETGDQAEVAVTMLSEYELEMSEELIKQVKQMIIDSLRIEGISIDDIDSNAPLFGDGLGLDSIDALQLVVGMEKDFGVSVPDATVGNKVFQSVKTMAGYIAANRP
jgi:acyl carrier protein